MNYESLGQRIRQQRKLLKMTQEALASAANVSTSYIGHIERGLKHCSLDTLIAICNTLNVSPTMLLQDSLDDGLVSNDFSLSKEARSVLKDIANVLREHEK